MTTLVPTTTELEDVAIPVAEPRRGLYGGQVVGLFQAGEQSLCTPEHEHRLRLRYDIVRG